MTLVGLLSPCTPFIGIRCLHYYCVLSMDIPICPPGPDSELAGHLRSHGWRWCEDMLLCILGTLANEDIRDSESLRGVRIEEIEGLTTWPDDVKQFIATQCQVRCRIVAFL